MLSLFFCCALPFVSLMEDVYITSENARHDKIAAHYYSNLSHQSKPPFRAVVTNMGKILRGGIILY